MKLDIALLPAQKEFFFSNVNSMFVAGYGSGKSHAGTVKTIVKKLQYPKHKVAYYLPHYGLVRDIAFDKFPTILDDMGLTYKLNKSDKEIHIDNYGSILFRSMDNAETIVGYEVAYSLIDEADILPVDKMEKVYQKILGRNRAIDGACVDAVSTPEGFKWLYKESQSGNFKVIRASSESNKFLSRDYIDQLRKQYPSELLDAYMHGKFVNLTSGTVYKYFDRFKHHTDEEIIQGEQLHIGQDFNIGGCCSSVFVIRNQKPICVDEFSSYDTQAIIDNIRNRYQNHYVTIYPDASGHAGKTNASQSDIRMLSNAGFGINAPKANGRVQDRVNSVNRLFDHKELKVNTKKCPRITKALEQQSYDKNGEPEKFSGAETVDDWNDSFGYFIVRMFGLVRSGISGASISYA